MAKRVRGAGSSHRPGGQGPSRTKKSSPSSAGAATVDDVATAPVLPAADIDGAMEIVAADTVEMSVAQPASTPARTRRSRRGTKIKADSLEARSAAENVYVRQDLRSIAVITGILLLGLLVAWVLFVPMDLAGLY